MALPKIQDLWKEATFLIKEANEFVDISNQEKKTFVVEALVGIWMAKCNIESIDDVLEEKMVRAVVGALVNMIHFWLKMKGIVS